MNLTIKLPCQYVTLPQWRANLVSQQRFDQMIQPGTVVRYVSHVIGGMVKVVHDHQEVIIHPATTKELGANSKEGT